MTTDFWIELGAATFTLAGIYIGSTTAWGAAAYLVALVFWYWSMFRKHTWGLVPLNVATTFVASFNLWKAL
jgi:hypothetical protein